MPVSPGLLAHRAFNTVTISEPCHSTATTTASNTPADMANSAATRRRLSTNISSNGSRVIAGCKSYSEANAVCILSNSC